MKLNHPFIAAAMLMLVATIGCGSAETKIPTSVSADEQKQLEASQQSATDAEMKHRQANPQ